jgi:hypothetical protein
MNPPTAASASPCSPSGYSSGGRRGSSLERSIVAEFHKDSGGRLKLFSLTTIERRVNGDGQEYFSRDIYDVEWSRTYGYLFDQSGAGGTKIVAVSGIYFVSGDVSVKEGPTQLVDAGDKPPWRSKRTRVIRARNRTRRLRALPKAFDLEPGWDLLDWLEHRAIPGDAVYCSTCRDFFPENSLCEHCWWCDQKHWYSTPAERCECKNREECHV